MLTAKQKAVQELSRANEDEQQRPGVKIKNEFKVQSSASWANEHERLWPGVKIKLKFTAVQSSASGANEHQRLWPGVRLDGSNRFPAETWVNIGQRKTKFTLFNNGQRKYKFTASVLYPKQCTSGGDINLNAEILQSNNLLPFSFQRFNVL